MQMRANGWLKIPGIEQTVGIAHRPSKSFSISRVTS